MNFNVLKELLCSRHKYMILTITLIILVFAGITISISVSKPIQKYTVSGNIEQKKEKLEEKWWGQYISFYVTVHNVDYKIPEDSYNAIEKSDWIELIVAEDGVRTVIYEQIPN